MYSQKLTVQNTTGIHARPATNLTRICQKHQSDIRIIKGTMVINPKSIISVLSGSLSQGTIFRLEIEGEDEEEAGKEISRFINELRD